MLCENKWNFKHLLWQSSAAFGLFLFLKYGIELWRRRERNKRNYSPNLVIEIYSAIYFCSIEHLVHYSRTMLCFCLVHCASGTCAGESWSSGNLHVIRKTQYYITHDLTKWSFIDTSVLEDHLSFPCSAFLLVVVVSPSSSSSSHSYLGRPFALD